GQPARLVSDAAPDVDDHTRSQPRDDLAVSGVVEREQRVRCRTLHRAFARELHFVPRSRTSPFERSSVQRTRRAEQPRPQWQPGSGPRIPAPCSLSIRAAEAPSLSDPAHTGDGPTEVGKPGDAARLADIAASAGLRRIAILAWRDLDDPEAGGS